MNFRIFRPFSQILLIFALLQFHAPISAASDYLKKARIPTPSCEDAMSYGVYKGRYWIGPDEFPLKETPVQLYAGLGDHGIKPQTHVVIPWEILSKGTAPLAWEEVRKNFPIMFYNVMNLKEHPGKYGPDPKTGHRAYIPGVSEKPKWALEQIGAETKSVNPMAFVWTEVESIQNFGETCLEHLDGKYFPILIQGNDIEKRINIAFGVRRDLKVDAELISHRAETWIDPLDGKEKLLFSRDMPVLILRRAGEEQPFLILVGTHNKSQRPSPGDPLSEGQRTAQSARQAKIIGLLRKRFGKKVLVVDGGDFNKDVRTGREFEPLHREGLVDAFDLKGSTPPENRITHTYHPKHGNREVSQLDAAFMPEEFKDTIKSVRVIPHKDASGNPKPLPLTYDEREKNPSDHMALELILDLTKAPE